MSEDKEEAESYRLIISILTFQIIIYAHLQVYN
jgi:hypothetical protein